MSSPTLTGKSATTNPVAGTEQVRPVRLARLHPPQPDHERRVEAPGRRGRPRRRDLEPRHLREGHHRQHRLHRSALELQKRQGPGRQGVYEHLAINDIQDAADVLRPVYDRTKLRDGYVSLEVSPYLANDTEGTLEEARRLWKAVNRPNLMIKVPATPRRHPGHPAVHQRGHQRQRHAAVRAGQYETVARGLHRGTRETGRPGGDPEQRRQRRQLLRQPHRQPGRRHAQGAAAKQPTDAERAGSAARACSARWRSPTPSSRTSATRSIFCGSRLGRRWPSKGAQTQRLLWASTSTKNPSYRDVHLRRGADRPRHGQHHSAGHLRRLPRSRQAAGQPRGRRRRRPRHHGDARRRPASP